MYHPFSIAQTIRAAWIVLIKNFIPLIVYSVASLFINKMIEFFNEFLFVGTSQTSQVITFFIQMVIQSYLVLSFYKLILTLMDKEYYEFEFKEIIPSIKMAFSFMLVAFMYTILIFILFAVNISLKAYPGTQILVQATELLFLLFLLLRSIFCICFIVDDDSSPFESLRQSFEITSDNFFKTLGILLITVCLMVIVLIPIIAIVTLFNFNDGSHEYMISLAYYVWLLLVFPMVQVIIMVTYRKLVYSHLDVDDDVAETN